MTELNSNQTVTCQFCLRECFTESLLNRHVHAWHGQVAERR